MTWPFGRCGCVGYLYNVVVVFVAATALLLVVVGTITPSGVCTTMTRRWCLRHLWRNEIHNLSSKRFPLTNVVSVFFQHGHHVWLNLYVEDCWNECWWWLVWWWRWWHEREYDKGTSRVRVCGFPRLEKTFPPVNRQIMYRSNKRKSRIAAMCFEDGGHIAMMPQLERVFTTWQWPPWMPEEWSNTKLVHGWGVPECPRILWKQLT